MRNSLRLTLLCLHLCVNAAWLGAVLSMLALTATANDLAVFALNDIAVWSSLLVVFTSLLFALFTPWGFLKFRWVSLKWAVLFALAFTGVFARTPAINALAAHADLESVPGDRTAALAWLAGEALVLLAVFALSVVKPWGRSKHALEPGPKLRAAIGVAFVAAAVFSVVQSAGLTILRHTPIAPVNIAALHDGRYVGDAHVGVDARTRVTIVGGKITAVEVVELPAGHYPDLARGVTRKMVEAQRIDVDGVTGATTTSRAIQKAAENALTAADRR